MLDLFTTDDGFVYACREVTDSGEKTAGFFTYNMHADLFERIPITEYIADKYGEQGFALARSLGDFMTCSLRSISSVSNLASYADGTVKVFDNNGFITETRKVKYENCPACSPEPVGRDLWFTVPEANAVINYSLKYNRIEFRIGGRKEGAFAHPSSLSLYDGRLYVCNASSYNIKTIDLDTYNVNSFYVFNEPVYKYFRVKDTEFAQLKSGIYKL